MGARVVRTSHARDGASVVGSGDPEPATVVDGHVDRRSKDEDRVGMEDQRFISSRIMCVESV